MNTAECKSDLFFEAPVIANGGMAVDISGHRMASEVAKVGINLGINTIGVLSGTGLGLVISRKLQNGDLNRELREAFDEFPDRAMAERVWAGNYIEGGRKGNPYKLIPMVNLKPARSVEELIIVSTFAEVWLAKKGHEGKIAINFLEKIQTPLMYGILGAMLAKVDGVFVGAGMPDLVPGVLDNFADYKSATYFLDVNGRRSTEFAMRLDPADFVPKELLKEELKRPRFAAIVSSKSLAELLTIGGMATGYVDALIVENFTAGGHNAPPRGAKKKYNGRGEYEYGERDNAEPSEIKKCGRPFLLAGSYASRLKDALDMGAAGVSVGTIPAVSRESNLREELKNLLIELAIKGLLDIFADPRCSPTEYPFNVVQIPGTMSDDEAYKKFEKECKIGYLRKAFRAGNGELIWRCFAENENAYLNKGGKIEDTKGRRCVCLGLLATACLGNEMPLVTLGRDISPFQDIISRYGRNYTIANVIEYVARDIPSIAI